MPGADFSAFLKQFRSQHPWLPPALAEHYAHLYGTRAGALLGDAKSLADLGRPMGALLYEREARFLRDTEWARTADDILTRRTKHALHMSEAQKHDFAAWMEAA